MLAAFERRDADREALVAELLQCWPDGRIKLYVTWRLLQLRRAHVATFLGGAYRPLDVSGIGAASVVAFARNEIVVAAPRLARAHVSAGLHLKFDDERIALGRPNATYRSLLDGRTVTCGEDGAVMVREAFAVAPMAVLLPA